MAPLFCLPYRFPGSLWGFSLSARSRHPKAGPYPYTLTLYRPVQRLRATLGGVPWQVPHRCPQGIENDSQYHLALGMILVLAWGVGLRMVLILAGPAQYVPPGRHSL